MQEVPLLARQRKNKNDSEKINTNLTKNMFRNHSVNKC